MTAATDFEQYALALPDGRWLYHLQASAPRFSQGLQGCFADGEPMTRQSEHSSWWATDHQAQVLTARFQLRPTVTGYRLSRPEAASQLFPAALTLDQWEQLRDARTAAEADAMDALYAPVHQPQDPVEHTFPGPFVVLEAEEPPGEAFPTWVASLPSTLTNRPEYLYCFPGYMPGLREYVSTAIKGMPHVDYCHSERSGEPAGLYVTIKVPFVQPKTHWLPNYGQRGQELRSGRQVATTVTQRFYLPVPDRVHGASYAQALAAWEQQTAFWIEAARSANVKACNACEGHGYLLDADETALAR